jgi:hypothetical protein
MNLICLSKKKYDIRTSKIVVDVLSRNSIKKPLINLFETLFLQ